MGLDLIETVYRIEEEFEITIPNQIAESLTTPKKVIDYLITLPEVNKKWSRDYVALSLWMILEDECLIHREDFNEDSRFVEDMGLN